MGEPSFRKLSRKDIPFLKSLLIEIWEIERFTADAHVADTIISSMLYSDLARQDYAEIAYIDNRPSGVLLAKINSKSHGGFLWRRMYNSYMKTLSSMDPQTIGEYLKVDSSFQRLLSDAAEGSELIFFMVSSEARGRGIGKLLMSHYISECHNSSVKKLHLVTDTQCDYSYYDKAGFTLLKEESFKLDLLSGSVNHRTFLYSLDL